MLPVLRRLLDDDPTAPRLTWYAADHASSGERVELSARVLATWVAKTANLLEEEFEVGPGSVVAIDLPTHWRTPVFQLAAWATGAAVRHGADRPADVLVSSSVQAMQRNASQDRIAVSLLPLATRFDQELPAGVLDYARVVTGYGDTHVPMAAPGPEDPALEAPALTHGRLLGEAQTLGADWPVGVRLLTDAGPGDVVRGPLAAWARAGSVVLAPGLDALGGSVVASERTTAVLRTRPAP
ncbi:TIGR03089 family protein [Kineococcus sp. TBRC 1896]|uniref:TIGR03089 family protein n=1 Tax=Kineococcus mangrovi TaxID=1660183 RepID=A0ABV4I6T9_9ACTN